MIGYESLGEISQHRETLLTDGIPVMRMATWEGRMYSLPLFVSYIHTHTHTLISKLQGHPVCVDNLTDLADSDWRPDSVLMGSVETAKPSPAGPGTTIWKKASFNTHIWWPVSTERDNLNLKRSVLRVLATFNIIGCFSVRTLARHWWASSVKDDCTGKLYSCRYKERHWTTYYLKVKALKNYFLLFTWDDSWDIPHE